MRTGDIIGQKDARQRLLTMIHEERLPHAMLFCGTEGCGKMPLALWLTRYLCCQNPGTDDACGECPSCRMLDHLAHPDVHFVFPVVKRRPGSDTVSDDCIDIWRQMWLDSPYFTFTEWLARIEAENRQAQIFVREADEIQRKLSLRSSQGGYKVMMIWLPEKMNPECGNKLLKLLEEPPAQTLFLMVSEEPDKILPTLTSRMQRFSIPPLMETDLANMLQSKYMLEPDDAADIAHRSQGSVTRALANIRLSNEHRLWLEHFTALMRLAYARRIVQLKEWSEQIAAIGRERQKDFLAYCQRMVRENFIYNFGQPEMIYMNREEQQFATRFAPFVNERNIMGISSELEEASMHIEQNANPKFVFFDLSLKMIMLLKT